MPTLKEYNVKLARLRNTRKLTKTMKMVSANKLRRAQAAQAAARHFEQKAQAILTRAGGTDALADHPLCLARRVPRSAHVVLLTSDKGLCGGFNNSLHKRLLAWLEENAARLGHVELSCCGRRGFQFFQGRGSVRMHYEGTARPTFATACHIGGDAQRLFLDGRHDEVYLAYNSPRGALSNEPVVRPLLPLALEAVPGTAPDAAWLQEPTPAALCAAAVPMLVNLRVYAALLDSSAGEHAARMAAMDSATNNAAALIDRLTLLRNRARQSTITRELIEIVAGAEALA